MNVTNGTMLGTYRVERLVGKGSMGAVYVAEDVRLRRPVALKILGPELVESERFRERFLLESQLAASLEHPNIVPIYAAGEQDGALYLAMRFVEGMDLRELIRARHHLEPRRALAILSQVGGALDAAHAVGLVHRDVKPANVIVAPGPPEHAYLCDFGLAKHASSVDSLSGERSFVGTISYIAPEQIEGGPVDGSADQYALACVLYECLTGVRPYERESELQTLFAHLREDAPPVSGIEPSLGDEIDAVFARALDKDPERRFESCQALVAAAAEALEVEQPSPGVALEPAGRRVRRRAVVLGALAMGLAVALAVAAAGVLLGRSDDPTVAPHALAVFDPGSGKLRWQVPFDTDPDFSIVDGRTAYVAFGQEGNFAVVDLDRRAVTKRIRYPTGQEFIGPVTGTTMWTGGPGDSVVPLDLRYGTAGEKVALDHKGIDENDPWVTVGGGSVWIAYGSPPTVARVDPATRRVTATIRLPHGQFWCCGAVRYADGQVWVVDRGTGALWRIDPKTNQVVARGSLRGAWAEDITAGGGYAWVPRTVDGGVWQVDATLKNHRLVSTGIWPYAASYGHDRVLVANRNDASVTSIDPLTGATTTLGVGGAPVSAAAAGGDLVVTLAKRAPDPYAGLEGKVATMLAADDQLDQPDPAVGAPDLSQRNQVHDAVDLRLVRYDDSDGDGVQEVVADGAELPRVTDGGRTWRFRVKPGYRFSPPSGAPVTATTFRNSIERALSPAWGDWSQWGPGGAYPNYLEDIIGMADYQSGKSPHLAGLRVEGDELVFRLSRPLRDLGARLALQPYAVVPDGTPIEDGGVKEPLPSAGPYYLASHDFNASAVLERNPNYPGPRKATFDAFVLRMLVGNDPALAAVEQGKGDLVVGYVDQNTGALSPLLAAGGPLDRKYGAGDDPRYVRTGLPFTLFIRFNTLAGRAFSDPRLRHAVALAVDREALARFWNATAADLFIPPGLASHRLQGTVYPLSEPQLERARRLMPGRRLTVTIATDPRFSQQAMAQELRRELRPLGIDVEIVLDWDRRANAAKYDAILDTWLLDYIDPSMTFGAVLDPVHAGYEQYPIVDPPIFTDPKWIARIRAVEKLPLSERDAGYARLDRELAEGPAPIATLAHGETAWFLSERVGCAHGIGINGTPDLAELCER